LHRARHGRGVRHRPPDHGHASRRRGRRRTAREHPARPRGPAHLPRLHEGPLMALLEMTHVHTFYGESHILVDLSLEVAEGEVVCLLGRNGAGKSTTLKSVIGLAPPRAGRIRLRGHDLGGLPPFRVARLGIGYVPEDRRVFPNLTVHENLEVARKTWGNSRSNVWTEDYVLQLFPHLQERR